MRKLFWFWIPVAFLILQIVLENALFTTTLMHLHSESGPHEALQFLVLVSALVIAVVTLRHLNPRKDPWLFAWLGLAALCSFYVAGEEISWGQHLANWATPEFWNAVNDQGETNLHNTSSWLDQKPRLLLEIGVIIGGILIPLLRRLKPLALPQRFAFIYPRDKIFITALIATGVKFSDTLGRALGFNPFERVSEVQELYFFWFVLLYLLMLRAAVMARRS